MYTWSGPMITALKASSCSAGPIFTMSGSACFLHFLRGWDDAAHFKLNDKSGEARRYISIMGDLYGMVFRRHGKVDRFLR